MLVVLGLGLSLLTSPSEAQAVSRQGQDRDACVTWDDRPCYEDQRPQTRTPEAEAIRPQDLNLARSRTLDLASRGYCGQARAAAISLRDQVLQDRVLQICGPERPQTPPPPVRLW